MSDERVDSRCRTLPEQRINDQITIQQTVKPSVVTTIEVSLQVARSTTKAKNNCNTPGSRKKNESEKRGRGQIYGMRNPQNNNR